VRGSRRIGTPWAQNCSMPDAPKSGPAKALEKLGLTRDVDLALHLPLRYEDETRLLPLHQARAGETVQVQGIVRDCRVESRSRRQLVVHLQDGAETLVLRFLHFYPAQQKAWAPGRLLRVRGEIRDGFFGREMVHPAVRVVAEDTPLPQALTPVYPASAQLPQAYLRKAVVSALARAPLANCCPPRTCRPACPPCARRCSACTTRRPAHRWRRSKRAAPGLATAEVRRAAGPAAVAGDGQGRTRPPACPGARSRRGRPARSCLRALALGSDVGAAPRGGRDRGRSGARAAHAPAAAGRRRARARRWSRRWPRRWPSTPAGNAR
jgi:hypothetical protein